MLKHLTAAILVGFAMLAWAGRAVAQTDYAQAQAQWRAEREAKLKTDDGWLTVAGLYWLKDGVNTVGTAAGNDFVLPAGSAAERVGSFDFQHGAALFRAAEGVTATVNDKAVTEYKLQADAKKPDTLKLDKLTIFLIKRGDRYALRLRDLAAPTRTNFSGLRWYPVNPASRVIAKFTPYETVREIDVPNIQGDIEKMKSPGFVTFTLNGKEHTLEPVNSGENKLFFIFRDLTSRQTTYQPGRFLYADAPQDGQVILDFNQAINPPCAFTAFATCPLPLKRNHLPIKIEAGELRYLGGPHEEQAAQLHTTASVR